MATLSTLELMLHEIQNQENLRPFGDHETPPELPQRPVSKARTPPRRATLSFHCQEFGGKKEEFVDDKRKRDVFALVEVGNCCQPNDGIGGLLLSENKIKNDEEERAVKGIIGIQKYFRGYQARFHYNKLKEGIITLQSFVRGENARREFQNSVISLLTQTNVKQEVAWKTPRNQETTVIYLQSVIRGWLSRRHLGYHGNMKNAIIENTKEEDWLHNGNAESEEHVVVSNSYILDLEQQVLRIETALRKKKRENSNLELQIQQIDRKWELHEAKMNSVEKKWQDELTSIQMNLASARERMTKEITHLPQNPNPRQGNGQVNLTIRQILELQEEDTHETNLGFCMGSGLDNGLTSRKRLEEELRKLKGRFKAWKKDFKVQLYEIKRAFDRFDHSRTEKVHKSCCVS